MTEKPTYEELEQRVKDLEKESIERRQVEVALRESEDKYRLLFENMSEGFALHEIITDELGRPCDFRFLEVNAACERLTGLNRKEMIGRRVREIVAESPWIERYGKVALTGEPEHFLDYSTTLERWFEVFAYQPRPGQCAAVFADINECKRTEEALKDSETRLRTLIRTIPDLVWLKDQQGTYLSCNSRFESFFGAKEKDIIGKTDYDFVDKELADSFRKHDKAAIAERQPSRNEEEVIFADDGHHEILETIKTPMYTSDGQLAGVLGIGRDITDRKRTEEKLQEALLRQNEAVKAANVGLWDWDLATNEIHYSAVWKRQFGYEQDEISDNFEEWESRVHPEDLNLTLQKIQQSIAEARQDHQVEFRFRHKDDTYRWILAQASVIADESGRPIRMLGSHIDITERKRAEEDLRESEEKLRLFIEHAPAALAMFDHKIRYIAVSRRWMADYGLGEQEIIGRSHYEIFPEIPDRWKAVHQRGLAGEVVKAAEDSFERIDGTIEWLNWEVRPWYKADGAVGGIVISTADLSEQKRMERERTKLQTQLIQAQKMESVGRLAGGVAHDFNNMLSIIIGYSELALEKLDPIEPLHANISEILEAAKRSMNITRQLLAFARQQTIAPKVLDLNDTVESMLKMLRRLIGENIDLVWRPGPELWPIKIDPSQVDQILANLCANARDAIVNVGKVTIETDNTSFDEAYCANHPGFVPGNYIFFAVSDDGSGLAPEILENIFEPFFTTKGLGKGTGLGLATVYGIVKQNKGFINVYSEPEQGTTIKIYLPRNTDPTVGVCHESTVEIPSSRGEMVLLVEDDGSILKLGRMMLASLGYTILTAITPGEAISLAKEHAGKIDLLITDVVMPEMNGRDLSNRLQALYPNLKTLFMSGYTANVIAHRGVLEEGVGFIPKPFSKKDLAVKVREVLDNAKPDR